MVALQYTGKPANWGLIPIYMRDGLDEYIQHGRLSGDFLNAVLCNDLRRAVERGDDVNRRRLHDYVTFLYNYAPSNCWGSLSNVQSWMDRGGLVGITSKPCILDDSATTQV